MMTMVLERLQTTNWSGFLTMGWTLCTVISMPTVPPNDLKVLMHSAVFTDHTLIVPSELALNTHTTPIRIGAEHTCNTCQNWH